MKKRMTNEEKINKINNDRKIMLENIKANINISNGITENSLGKLLEVITIEEKNTKEYKALLAAKEMIVNLTKMIVDSNSVEEVANIRKRVNYYINKIKKILIARGVTSTEIDKLSENVNYMRKDISEYIRFLKRENNIKEIIELNSNYSSLSLEEKNKLKKLLRNESNYIKRKQNIDSTTKETSLLTKEEKQIMKEVKKEISLKEAHKTLEEFKIDTNSERIFYESELELALRNVSDKLKAEKSKQNFDKSKLEADLRNEASTSRANNSLKPAFDKSRLEEALKSASDKNAQSTNTNYVSETSFETFTSMYNLANPYEYGSSLGKNIVNFFRNIPIYISNGKVIDKMLYEYHRYHRGKDLSSFIEHTKEKNSIRTAIATMFKNAKLFQKEETCVKTHEECAYLIENYLINSPSRTLSR